MAISSPERLTLPPGSFLIEASPNPLVVINALDPKPYIGGYIVKTPIERLRELTEATDKPLVYELDMPDRCNLPTTYQPEPGLLEDLEYLGISDVIIQANCLPTPRAVDQYLIETIREHNINPWIDLRMRGCVLTKNPFQAIQATLENPANTAGDFIVMPHGQRSLHSYLDFFRDFPEVKPRLYIDGSMEKARISTTEMNAALGNRWHYIVPSRILVDKGL